MEIYGYSLFNGSIPALSRRGIRNILVRIVHLWTEIQTYDYSIQRKSACDTFDRMIMNE
jgi:hypothetical protein